MDHCPVSRGLSVDKTVERLVEIFQNPLASRAVFNTIYYGVTATAIMVAVGLAIAVAAARLRGPAADALDALATMPIAIPGLVVAYAYFLTSLNLTFSLRQISPEVAEFFNP